MNFLNTLEQMPFSIWVRESSSIWAFPTFLVVHTIGMSIVAGLSAMISLAVLGFWPKMPIRPMERLFPLIWIGFWVNAATGTVLLIADAATKLTNWDFYVKMAFVFAGVCDDCAVWVNDEAATGVNEIGICAGAVYADDVGLVFNRARLQKRDPMVDSFHGPIRNAHEHFGAP